MSRSSIHRDLRSSKYRQRLVEDKRSFLRRMSCRSNGKYSSGGVEKAEWHQPRSVTMPQLRCLEGSSDESE